MKTKFGLLFLISVFLALAVAVTPSSNATGFEIAQSGKISSVMIFDAAITPSLIAANSSTWNVAVVISDAVVATPRSITAKAQDHVSEQNLKVSAVMALSPNFPNPFNAQGGKQAITNSSWQKSTAKYGGTEMLAQLATVRIIELIDSGACIKTVENYAWFAPAEHYRVRLCPKTNGINTEITVTAKSGRIALGT